MNDVNVFPDPVQANSTAVLINMLKSSEKKMIVTTIQKMANAVKNPKYADVMDAYKDKKVVFIIDECHRSQFGKMHSLIQKHFERANYIGFSGSSNCFGSIPLIEISSAETTL